MGQNATSKTSSVRFTPAPPPFIKPFYAHVMPADLAGFSDEARARMAASIWHLAQSRKAATPKIRLFNPTISTDGWTVDHTVLEIVNDDMPFLVDSVTGALQQQGLSLHLVIHPVMKVERDSRGNLLNLVTDKSTGQKTAESFLQIQMDHCLDPLLLKTIEANIKAVLVDVRAANEDWPSMRQKMQETIAQTFASKHQESSAENAEEVKSFLHWLDNNNFTYLGYRDIDLQQKGGKLASITVLPESGLGVLRDAGTRMFGGLRDLDARKGASYQRYVRQHHLLVITKTNEPAKVHRPIPMDAIFVRRFNKDGEVIGERLFVGLFTSQSYSQSPTEIPFLRHKIDYVLNRAGFTPESHNGKALTHILNNYLHDELFQISLEELLANSLGILQLQERARVALFARRDPFDRFATCLIYVPRDRYDSDLRAEISSFLEAAYKGKANEWNVRIDDSSLARLFITIRLNPSSLSPDVTKLETALRTLCRAWPDRLRDCLVDTYGEATALTLLRRYSKAFPLAYRDVISPAHAVDDMRNLERSKNLLPEQLTVDLSQPDASGFLHLKLFQSDRPLALSEALPLIENMGLKIDYMGGPYEILPTEDGGKSIFIHEFVGKPANPLLVAFQHVKSLFEESFSKLWTGEIENDAFNSLTLHAGMAWREIRVLRSLARYLRQLRIPYSHEMMASTFVAHPRVAQDLYALFETRHNPAPKSDRAKRCVEIEKKITEALTSIGAMEEDRIIRRYLNLVQASLRTNHFQVTPDSLPKSYLSIKFDSRSVEFMPLPKPLYEIFVYSPRTEAVHLRGGKVARGGIRWSDRRDDFRNEILGLMKAQMVKNSVIVPVGSKGGFIVKRPPAEADKMQAEGIACYRIMMCGLLDLTDNRVGDKIVPPAHLLRHDGDDPYLVVAADKGTAKFSDIANGISQEYGFWLNDAFASGGSAGYDHKQMGITARGAWEAVKRHFRELGKDCQTTDFTCIGVGDMSGDVFGNGMLLSEHIRLLGAFDHRHIFCDPDPEAKPSHAERLRLFNLPRSSWMDYAPKLISKGGGIFARTEKAIKISPEMKKAYGVTADSLAPAELIQAMLRAEIELLFFGGIGTYVKATDETNEEVGDRATESLRIDGHEVRAKIIGEGANLGMTQRGRIEYALKGGHLNSDAIDNSAGVDTSDHEVNIKILLRKIVDKGSLTMKARNSLLASMTNDVGAHVLEDNYYQTQALSLAESHAVELLPQHGRCMQLLEKTGLLNRAVEYLPDSDDLAERQRMGKGLTRPEMAVLLSYAKIWLYQELLDSPLPDDAALQEDLVRYFPEALQKHYAKPIEQHQLRREIIATSITNSLINRTGIHCVLTTADTTGKDVASITRAYLLTREAFGLNSLWKQIEALDNKVPATIQTQMLLVIEQTLNNSIQWFLNEGVLPSKLAPLMQTYSKGLENLVRWLETATPDINEAARKTEATWVAQGVPLDLARRVSLMPLLGTSLDLTRLAAQSGGSIHDVAEIFFGLGHRLSFDWLMERTRSFVAKTQWQREALALILNDLASCQRRLTAHLVAKGKKGGSSKQKLADWLKEKAPCIEHYDTALQEWRGVGLVDIAMLTLASRHVTALLD